jgi:hypothetical protein
MTNGLQVRHHSMPLITTAYTALTHDYRTAARMAGQGGIYTPLSGHPFSSTSPDSPASLLSCFSPSI